MDLYIRHQTDYSYSKAVFPGVHYLNFHPQIRSYLQTRAFNVEIDPQPDSLTARLDPENNLYHQLWFSGKTSLLSIQVDLQVEITPFNPFNFIVDTHGPQNTSEYQKNSESFLQIYRAEDMATSEITDFANQFYHEDLIQFFTSLNLAISESWNHHERFEMNILSPQICFETRAGSCRDLARMLMAMLRSLGFPARFVSGYCYAPGEEGHELHAWVEVYIPGAGWLGLDPSLGLLTTEKYIPVAASFEPSRTMPVQGFYHGDATSDLKTTVLIQETPFDQP